MQAHLITIEGIDGAGKSTIATWVVAWLKQKGVTAILSHEPGGTRAGAKIRTLLLAEPLGAKAETLLFFADRAEHVRTVIAPFLQKGVWVVCDRFIDSTFAYQGGGRGVDEKILEALSDWVLDQTCPNLTFLLDIPVEMALARTKRDDRIEEESKMFFEKVRHTYLQRANKYKNRIVIIDASQPLEAVQEKVISILQARFP